jgi:hypothetical protein
LNKLSKVGGGECLALLAILVGCGGKASSESHPQSVLISPNNGGAAGSSDPGTALGGYPITGILPPGDGGTGASVDAGPPISAFGGSAGVPSVIDAGPACIDASTCTVTSADVTCNSEADCKLFTVPSCSAKATVIGVNVQSAIQCATSKCVAAPYTDFVFQDCKETSDLVSAGVYCIDHQCVSSLSGCNPCDAK